MATVSGRVLFDAARTAAPPGVMGGIPNVPVVLQDIDSTRFIAVLSDPLGEFSFINVPDGNYRLAESYRTAAVPSPADFGEAMPGPVITAVVPPISYAPNPPEDATHLDCTRPNTLLFGVNGTDVTGQFFCNGPVRHEPIEAITDPCAVISAQNLLMDADQGTMGSFPQGSNANRGVPDEPYPDNTPDFVYVLPAASADEHFPDDGEYTVQNILNEDASCTAEAWWRIADRTTGNETGRMMVVNGHEPGSVFYTETVAVAPHTNYLFSAWIINLIKTTDPRFFDPKLGVEIISEEGTQLYKATLGHEIPVNPQVPEWHQVGTVINSQAGGELTVKFLSEGPAQWGNDYAIDDVSLQEISVPEFVPHKQCSVRRIALGETAVYTVTIANTCQSPLTDMFFRDTVPDGLAFVEGSITINGVNVPDADPGAGFALPDLPGGQSHTVTFDVLAEFLPETNPAINRAEIEYRYTPVQNGIPGQFSVVSNEVSLRITHAWCGLLSAALGRERAKHASVLPDGLVSFDKSLVSVGEIIYQPDGRIDITGRGIYTVCWFVAGKYGLAANTQRYTLRRFDYSAGDWTDIAGGASHIRISPVSGFSAIRIDEEELARYGKATIGLFNTADAGITPASFEYRAAIAVFGANFECISNRTALLAEHLASITSNMQTLSSFILDSQVTELPGTAPFTGLGVAVIQSGNAYNFWGTGTLETGATLEERQTYYLITSENYPPLQLYQGAPTAGTLWLERPGASTAKYKIKFDATGIYFVPGQELQLPPGAGFLFTQSLILAV